MDRKTPRFAALMAAVLALTLLASCGGSMSDCSGRAEFLTGSLPAASVGTAYSATIEVGLLDEPEDDFYDYKFTVHNPLPPGLNLSHAARERRLTISGTPTAAGVYELHVEVYVELPDAWWLVLGPPCRPWRERTFRIGVAG